MSVRFSNCPLYSGLASRKWHLKVKVTVSSHHGAVFNYSPIRADSQYGSKASPGAQLTLSTLSKLPWQPTPLQGSLGRPHQGSWVRQVIGWTTNVHVATLPLTSHQGQKWMLEAGLGVVKVQHFKMRRRQAGGRKEIQSQQIQREGVRCVYLFHLHLTPWGGKYLFSVFWTYAIGMIILTLQGCRGQSHGDIQKAHHHSLLLGYSASENEKKTCKQLFSLLLIYLLCVPVWGKFL